MSQTTLSSRSGIEVASLDESILLPQLGCPAGSIGIAVGDMLGHSNRAVIEAAFELLDLRMHEQVLEVGLGNGAHIPFVLTQAPGVMYSGVDLSPTMIAVARCRNATLVREGRVLLETADVVAMPFSTASFDKAITINCTYFWPDLTAGLKAIRRMLRQDGTLVIAAITPESAAEMPFAVFGFAVHDAATLEAACIVAGFERVSVGRFVEPSLDPLADPPALRDAPREFYLLRASAA
ncbi:class I SAM-dependent methyltransferase [Paraburkholderia sp. D15]|uniref:class I SAM-dependent methyltransferase n=1 Tax=Paraburkholderia sp. D15 TaxID=2880218 RepID=UPI00247A3C39|nr:class I SAM-dependent methyltransferase [Paraburkholderia sp. D15]WGS52062.1 class I SAM-dependent methyltransferase [Paraburkholderia sp. D15]